MTYEHAKKIVELYDRIQKAFVGTEGFGGPRFKQWFALMKTEKYKPFVEEWLNANHYIEEVNRKTEEAKDIELLDRLIANGGNL